MSIKLLGSRVTLIVALPLIVTLPLKSVAHAGWFTQFVCVYVFVVVLFIVFLGMR